MTKFIFPFYSINILCILSLKFSYSSRSPVFFSVLFPTVFLALSPLLPPLSHVCASELWWICLIVVPTFPDHRPVTDRSPSPIDSSDHHPVTDRSPSPVDSSNHHPVTDRSPSPVDSSSTANSNNAAVATSTAATSVLPAGNLARYSLSFPLL